MLPKLFHASFCRLSRLRTSFFLFSKCFQSTAPVHNNITEALRQISIHDSQIDPLVVFVWTKSRVTSSIKKTVQNKHIEKLPCFSLYKSCWFEYLHSWGSKLSFPKCLHCDWEGLFFQMMKILVFGLRCWLVEIATLTGIESNDGGGPILIEW